MSRRSFVLAVGIFLFLLGGSGAALFLLMRYEPRHYARAPLPPAPERFKQSEEFQREFATLISSASGERDWYAHFTDEQINSYFASGFVQSGLDAKVLPPHITQPRVVIERERIHLMFRYGSGFWSTILSIDLRIWLAKQEPNAIVLEVEGLHAGALPVSVQSLLDHITRVGRENAVDVSWYRRNGHPTAVLRFQGDPQRSTVLLEAVQLEQGAIRIKGRSNDNSPLRTQFGLWALAGLLPQPQ